MKQNKKILIVDDEQDLREILQFNFELAGYDVDTAESAEEALTILSEEHSLILLDIMMQGMSGIEMANIVRKELKSFVPIIFLTAKIEDNDLLRGFNVGADDYIKKPFSFPEILARINAVLRRSSQNTISATTRSTLKLDNRLSIDLDKKTAVTYDGNTLKLTPKEFGILTTLVANPNKIFSRAELLNKVWNDDVCVVERTVDVHIAKLRQKLGEDINIVNRQGFGYCIE